MTEFKDWNACPVCGCSEKTTIYKDIIHTCNVLKKAGLNITNAEVKANVNECKLCHHRFLSRVLDERFLKEYYSVVGSEYYDSIKESPIDRNKKLTKKVVEHIKRNVESGADVLEVGSGLGHLLNELKINNYNCFGVEPSKFISELSRKMFDLNIITGVLDNETFGTKKFDLVILNDVIEHIYDLNELFKVIEYYLKPNAKIFVLTGNSKSLYAKITGPKWQYFFSWEHVSFFNKNSIKKLFQLYGIEMVYFKKVEHSGSLKHGLVLSFYTARALVTNALKIRSNSFFHMAFDHFIAIGQKKGK